MRNLSLYIYNCSIRFQPPIQSKSHLHWSLYSYCVLYFFVLISQFPFPTHFFFLYFILLLTLDVFFLQGKYYPILEMISQLYRSLLPIHPWFIYIYASYDQYGYGELLNFLTLFLSLTHLFPFLSVPARGNSYLY